MDRGWGDDGPDFKLAQAFCDNAKKETLHQEMTEFGPMTTHKTIEFMPPPPLDKERVVKYLKSIRDCGGTVPYDYQYKINELITKLEQ